MAEVLVSPDIESAAVSYLRAKLGLLAVKVATSVPSIMPATMVRVVLTGGDRLSVAADVAQLTVECWAPDGPTASNLARITQAHMFAASADEAGSVFIRKVESIGGVQSFPDPDTNKPRYIFTVRWFFRPSATI